MQRNTDDRALRESILELQVNAALAGHDLGSFEPVNRGYEVRCRRCGKTAWLGESGLQYSLLGEQCPMEDSSSMRPIEG